ncbi:MAG: hypothetical protein ACRCYS_17525 [Beijerinckiaceae bacterium]
MLDALRFVQGAIQKNGITPELEHFIIKDGRVTGFNGYLALSAPIDLTIEAMPKAQLFHKALQACGDTVAISQTKAGRLHIKSGGFGVYIPCIDQTVFEAKPEGVSYAAPVGLAKAFARMLPFIGEDASRPWAMGLAIGSGTYTATNNVILLQVWDGHQLPTINCPRFAVAEVARIKEDPVEIKVSDSSVSFIYADGKWLRSQVLSQEWPTEKMNSILERPSNPAPLPAGFFEAVDQLAPFAMDGAASPVFVTEEGISTGAAGSEEGAFYSIKGLPAGQAFRLKALQLLKEEVSAIDFGISPALFFGSGSRGALIGMNY